MGVSRPFLTQIENDEDRVLGTENLAKAADVLGVSTDYLLGRATEETSSSSASTSIPLTGEVTARGTVKSEALVHNRGGLPRAAADAFTYPERIQVAGAGPRWYAVTSAIDARSTPLGDLRVGDILVLDPTRPPKVGDLVVGSWSIEETEQVDRRLTRLRRIREVEGVLELVPVAEDDPSGILRIGSPGVEVLAVVVELRRKAQT
jgi:hypothetical protein